MKPLVFVIKMQTNLALIVDDVRTMLETHPDIDAKQTLIVNFDKFWAINAELLYLYLHKNGQLDQVPQGEARRSVTGSGDYS